VIYPAFCGYNLNCRNKRIGSNAKFLRKHNLLSDVTCRAAAAVSSERSGRRHSWVDWHGCSRGQADASRVSDTSIINNWLARSDQGG
jgi:hypothetical protein